ncbi:MAG TPA: FAD-dependent oxidoreductase [Dongiaceae bacterium]
MQTDVAIIGGGLAGLVVARWLHRSGIEFTLLEARDRLGGRIFSAGTDELPSHDGFDLGPSWFWPDMQPELDALVRDLGLPMFAQNTDGDMLFEHVADRAAQRYPSMWSEPLSMRLAGGTSALITALAGSVPAERIRLNTRIMRIELRPEDVELATDHGNLIQAQQVVIAAPPRLLEETVRFSPALDAETISRWRQTPTWMAPHAKFFALYDRPFWRDAGLSGAARSIVGPLVEMHDATSASGRAALFGFVGVPARRRRAVGQEAVAAASIAQLTRLFGAEAASPTATLFKDWAADPLTATEKDQVAGDHPYPDARPWVTSDWQRRLVMAGSETSRTAPGYLAGAVEAAERAVMEILARLDACSVPARSMTSETQP